MIVAGQVPECLQDNHALLVSLLPDELVKQLIPAVPKYLAHCLHLLVRCTLTTIGALLILLLMLSFGLLSLLLLLCLRVSFTVLLFCG